MVGCALFLCSLVIPNLSQPEFITHHPKQKPIKYNSLKFHSLGSYRLFLSVFSMECLVTCSLITSRSFSKVCCLSSMILTSFFRLSASLFISVATPFVLFVSFFNVFISSFTLCIWPKRFIETNFVIPFPFIVKISLI